MVVLLWNCPEPVDVCQGIGYSEFIKKISCIIQLRSLVLDARLSKSIVGCDALLYWQLDRETETFRS